LIRQGAIFFESLSGAFMLKTLPFCFDDKIRLTFSTAFPELAKDPARYGTSADLADFEGS
jgi:hypothetical protein